MATDTVANFDAGDLARLTPEAAESFKVTMARAGYDAGSIDAALSARGSPSPAPSPQPSSVKVPVWEGDPDLRLSPEQKRAAIDHLSKFWTGDPAALDGLQGSEESKAIDPNSYRLNYGSHAALAGDALGAFDTELKVGFAQAGIPHSHAQPLVDAILSTLDKYPPDMPDEARRLQEGYEGSDFARLPNSDELLHYAQIAYHALPASLLDMLNEHGALNSAKAYVALANIGRQMSYQTKGR